MPPAHRALRSFQYGKEVTRGTAVAATRNLQANTVGYTPLVVMDHYEDQMRGVLARSSQDPSATRHGTTWTATDSLDFDQVLLAFLAGMHGGISGVAAGTTPERYDWTFDPPNAADPTPDAFTLRFDEFDGARHDGLVAPYGLVSQITITGGIEGNATIAIQGFARRTVAGALTAGLAVPDLLYAPNLRWSVYDDPTGANLGTTQVDDEIYGFTWTWRDWLFPDYKIAGRDDLDFTKYGWTNRRVAALTINVEHDTAADGFVPRHTVYKGASPDQTPRFLRLQIDDGATVARSLTLDGCYTHDDNSMDDRGAANDDASAVTVNMRTKHDSTWGRDVQVVVRNGLDAFP